MIKDFQVLLRLSSGYEIASYPILCYRRAYSDSTLLWNLRCYIDSFVYFISWLLYRKSVTTSNKMNKLQHAKVHFGKGPILLDRLSETPRPQPTRALHRYKLFAVYCYSFDPSSSNSITPLNQLTNKLQARQKKQIGSLGSWPSSVTLRFILAFLKLYSVYAST